MRKKSFYYFGIVLSLFLVCGAMADFRAEDFRGFSPERTSLGFAMHYDRGGPTTTALTREIRKLDQLLVKYLRLTPAKLPTSGFQPCRILFSENFPAGHFAVTGVREVTIEISLHNGGDFLVDPIKFRKLVGAMFYSRIGVYQDGVSVFPYWISSGLMAELVKLRSHGRVMVDGADYPLLRAILESENGDKCISPNGALAADPLKLPLAAREYYYELCRFWNVFWLQTEVVGADFIFDYVCSFAGGENRNGNDLLFQKLAESGISDEKLIGEMAKIVFDSFHPRSGEGTARVLADWQKFELELINSDGKKEGEKIPFELNNLPELIAKNPLYTEALRERILLLSELINQCESGVQLELESLRKTLENIATSPTRLRRNKRDLANSLEQTASAIKLQIMREEFIGQTEREFLAPGVFFVYGTGVPESPSIIGQRGEELLELAEKKFLSD